MDIRQKIFEIRSYTPIPFVIAMAITALPTMQSLIAGFTVAFCGELLRLWGVSIAGSETRTTGPVGATHLITEGPFGYVRNPLYVGNMMLYTGIGIMANGWMPWLPIIAFAYFAFQYWMIVSIEEEHLRKAFGEEYERYTKNVPRFIPRMVRYRGDHSFHRDPNFAWGIQSERRTLQAFGSIVTLLIILFFVRGS